ncbi:hypothetical protein COO60DRAFT_1643060 [Scenedesmus sp. NREL 46B-D3]|nr:hypothetical protein COO60DRAFT_1643060 [Scenedesmus sp. NREL 46B-D3]
MLGTALNKRFMTDTAGVRQQLQEHSEMLELLLANVAAMASQLNYQMEGKTIVQMGSGTSSSSSSSSGSSKAAGEKGKQSSSAQSTQQQKREFPCLHSRLFAALGCANAAEVLGVPEEELSFEQEQEQCRRLLTPAVCLGLLDAVQQLLLLLLPDTAVADTALAMAYQACSHTCAAAGHARWQDVLWSELSAVPCLAQLLAQLVPAGRGEQESATLYGLGRLLTVVALRADDSALVPVLSADLASAEAAFEAALRCQSRPNGPQLQTFDAAAKAIEAASVAAVAEELAQQRPNAVNARAATVAAAAATAAVKLARVAAPPAPIASAAAELHGLLTTCCKSAVRVFHEYPSMLENYGLGIATAANNPRSSKGPADAAPWVALVARCMQISGAAVAAAVLTPASAQTELDDVCWLMQHVQRLSSSSCSSAAGLSFVELQQLQELQEELELGLWKAVKALRTWSNTAVETAADLLQEVRREVKPAVAQQLEAFGAAVAAQVPVKLCCNRPGCANLGQLSETVLVGGKGNICSGCKVARYCGKDCQVQHWKQHKASCKRIQATRLRGPMALLPY